MSLFLAEKWHKLLFMSLFFCNFAPDFAKVQEECKPYRGLFKNYLKDYTNHLNNNASRV